ncbi:MAG: hypothetical protein LIO74_07575 [Ruminococcus sp.]|nr:hypothetical protein [Ruminococcus sp.]
MKSIRFLAYTTAIAFGIGIAAGSLYSEAAASTVSAVSVAYSELLDGVPDSQITGEIVVAVYEQPIHVKITSCTSEDIFTYYDMDLAPEEGMGATAYTFYVCYCEVARNPDVFYEVIDFFNKRLQKKRYLTIQCSCVIMHYIKMDNAY